MLKLEKIKKKFKRKDDLSTWKIKKIKKEDREKIHRQLRRRIHPKV